MKKILLVILCFCNSIGIAQTTVQKSIGDPAPALKLVKWFKGKPFKEFQKGKVYVVEFWATWCVPCVEGMPHLSELARKYRKDVTVLGVSILERAGTDLPAIEKFAAGKSEIMDYNVGAQEGTFMADNWMKAYGENAIPQAFVVDKQGRIAWLGAPKNLDTILPKVIAGKWDINYAAKKRAEFKKLSPIDGNEVVRRLNPFMGNPGRPEEGLKEIEVILKQYPGLEYFPKMGNFIFWNLVKAHPDKAIDYGRKWIAASDFPSYSVITDAVYKRQGLPKELYLFAVEAFQAQMDYYPRSVKFNEVFKKMSDLYKMAGEEAKAAEYLKKSETYKAL